MGPHKAFCSISQDEHNSSVLNNHILGAFLHNRRVGRLRRPVEIHFRHDKELVSSAPLQQRWRDVGLPGSRPSPSHFLHPPPHQDSSNATCVFWQPAGTGSAGNWSREGCETQHQKGTVRCLCNHLTYFAVLLVRGPCPSSSHHVGHPMAHPICTSPDRSRRTT